MPSNPSQGEARKEGRGGREGEGGSEGRRGKERGRERGRESVCVGRMQRHLKPEPHELDPRGGHSSVNKSGEKAPGPVS